MHAGRRPQPCSIAEVGAAAAFIYGATTDQTRSGVELRGVVDLHFCCRARPFQVGAAVASALEQGVA